MLHTSSSLETKKIAKKQLSGHAIIDILYPKGSVERVPAKNYQRENALKIKKLQREIVSKQESAQTEEIIKRTKQSIKVAEKFGHVSSKVYQPKLSPRASEATSLNSSMANLSVSNKSTVSIPRLTKEPRFPCPQDVYIPESGRKLAIGQMPKYLLDRKMKWAAERESKLQAEIVKKQGGKPGLVIMSDEDKAIIVQGLKQKEMEIQKELDRLPLTLKTRRLQERKLELETEYLTVLADMEKFSSNMRIWIKDAPKEEFTVAAPVAPDTVSSPRISHEHGESGLNWLRQ